MKEFDSIVQDSLYGSLRMVGDDCLHAVKAFIQDGGEKAKPNAHLDLQDVDRALDALYTRFSKVIKYVTILQISSLLKLKPPRLTGSLFWMVEELRADTW